MEVEKAAKGVKVWGITSMEVQKVEKREKRVKSELISDKIPRKWNVFFKKNLIRGAKSYFPRGVRVPYFQ